MKRCALLDAAGVQTGQQALERDARTVGVQRVRVAVQQSVEGHLILDHHVDAQPVHIGAPRRAIIGNRGRFAVVAAQMPPPAL